MIAFFCLLLALALALADWDAVCCAVLFMMLVYSILWIPHAINIGCYGRHPALYFVHNSFFYIVSFLIVVAFNTFSLVCFVENRYSDQKEVNDKHIQRNSFVLNTSYRKSSQY